VYLYTKHLHDSCHIPGHTHQNLKAQASKRSEIYSIGGFHVTQVSLIITQVENNDRLPFDKLSQKIEIS